jgi:uncharacterized protein (TIGR02246 family)
MAQMVRIRTKQKVVHMPVSDKPDAPEAVIHRFAELIGAGDLEGALALYEEDAVFLPEPGRLERGREAIQAALTPFAALRPTITGEIERTMVAGDTALVINAWTLAGTDPAGEPVRMAAKSADVLRRREDGRWGILIDDPWGGAAA